MTGDASPGMSARRAGTIGPDSYAVAGHQKTRRIRQRGFGSIQIHLAPFERRRRLASRAETEIGGEELVEPRPRVVFADGPLLQAPGLLR
jgi:hypothetical protein